VNIKESQIEEVIETLVTQGQVSKVHLPYSEKRLTRGKLPKQGVLSGYLYYLNASNLEVLENFMGFDSSLEDAVLELAYERSEQQSVWSLGIVWY